MLLFLTNPYQNLIYMVVFFFLILRAVGAQSVGIGWFFILCWKGEVLTQINVPLSNTLFFIHPLLLFGAWAWASFLALTKKIRHLSFWFYLFLLNSLGLGGYWSLQEFNWGGWWNWDALEFFSFFIFLGVLGLGHMPKKFKRIFLNKTKSFCFTIMLLYFIFNKLGLNSSIHVFLKSKGLINNFWIGYLGLGLLGGVLRKQTYQNTAIVVYAIIMVSTQALYFFKFLFLWFSCFLVFFRFKIFLKLNWIRHEGLLVGMGVVALFNYNNDSYLISHSTLPMTTLFFYSLQKISLLSAYNPTVTLFTYHSFWFNKIINSWGCHNWFFSFNNIFLCKTFSLTFYK